jgi:hypothetical protein
LVLITNINNIAATPTTSSATASSSGGGVLLLLLKDLLNLIYCEFSKIICQFLDFLFYGVIIRVI